MEREFVAVEVCKMSAPSHRQLSNVERTPNVYPEFFKTSACEAINTNDSEHSTSEGGTQDDAIVASVLAECQRPAYDRENTNGDSLPCSRSYKPSRLETQEPHRQAKTTNQTSKSTGYFSEDQCEAAEDDPCHECSNEIGSLYRVAHWWIHNIEYQNRDT